MIEKLKLLTDKMGPTNVEAEITGAEEMVVANSADQLAKSQVLVDQAAATWLLFKCGKHIRNKEGSSRMAAIAPMMKQFYNWTSTPAFQTVLPNSFLAWLGIQIPQEEEAPGEAVSGSP